MFLIYFKYFPKYFSNYIKQGSLTLSLFREPLGYQKNQKAQYCIITFFSHVGPSSAMKWIMLDQPMDFMQVVAKF